MKTEEFRLKLEKAGAKKVSWCTYITRGSGTEIRIVPATKDYPFDRVCITIVCRDNGSDSIKIYKDISDI